MIRVLAPALLALLCATEIAALYHNDVTPETFDELIDPSKAHILIEFYAPWCGHCKSLAPEYEKLGNTFKDHEDVVIAQVDADKHSALANRFSISGLPTLKWLQKGSTMKDIIDCDAGRNAKDLLKYVNDKTGLSVRLKGSDFSSLGVELSEDNFDEVVTNGGKHAFIKFFAPWCGHCKAMKPSWEELNKLYADEESVVIGSVNCDEERSLCEKQGVEGFPTVKYYAPGGEAEAYSGAREAEPLAAYLSPKAGLDLAHDGGVLPHGGVIDGLAEHVQRFVKATSEDERSNVVNVCKEHVEGLGDEGASQKFGYYLKVFKKVSEKGVEYIETERKRLGKIMESADDMEGAQRRSFLRRINVLGAFGGK